MDIVCAKKEDLPLVMEMVSLCIEDMKIRHLPLPERANHPERAFYYVVSGLRPVIRPTCSHKAPLEGEAGSGWAPCLTVLQSGQAQSRTGAECSRC